MLVRFGAYGQGDGSKQAPQRVSKCQNIILMMLLAFYFSNIVVKKVIFVQPYAKRALHVPKTGRKIQFRGRSF
jgi:hypothetical protein